MQLSGLEFESPVQILDDPSESSLIDHEIIPQNLQQATVQVTGMIGRLDECLSLLEGKLSDSPNEPEARCEIPPRPVTPQRSLETTTRSQSGIFRNYGLYLYTLNHGLDC